MTPQTELQKLLIIAGPTSVGKSSFAMKLAQYPEIKGEIVSVDSVQVYKGLDIGTSKPTQKEREQVPHHMIDFLDPNEEYNAADFMADARRVIDEIFRRGGTPIVVGGTNLYIRILTYGIFDAPPRSDAIREKHRQLFHDDGAEALFEQLRDVDPHAAERLHPNDLVRVSRALEVFELTGKPISSWQAEHAFKTPHYDATILGFTRPREQLYHRINVCVDKMLAAGLYEEWLNLVENGVNPDSTALNALGYRHMKLLHDATSEEERVEAIRLMKRDTRRFAKQQLSWMRNDPRTHWFYLPEEEEKALEYAFSFLSSSQC